MKVYFVVENSDGMYQVACAYLQAQASFISEPMSLESANEHLDILSATAIEKDYGIGMLQADVLDVIADDLDVRRKNIVLPIITELDR